ncbi:uncharacterized [Tachysurus ichikawai]
MPLNGHNEKDYIGGRDRVSSLLPVFLLLNFTFKPSSLGRKLQSTSPLVLISIRQACARPSVLTSFN